MELLGNRVFRFCPYQIQMDSRHNETLQLLLLRILSRTPTQNAIADYSTPRALWLWRRTWIQLFSAYKILWTYLTECHQLGHRSLHSIWEVPSLCADTQQSHWKSIYMLNCDAMPIDQNEMGVKQMDIEILFVTFLFRSEYVTGRRWKY